MVDVPSMEEFLALKAKVEGLELPEDVKDALAVILNYLIFRVES